MTELYLFNPEQARRVGRYWQILYAVATGHVTRRSIANTVGLSVCPALIDYLVDLERAGYIKAFQSKTPNKLPVWIYRITPEGHAAMLGVEETGAITMGE